MALVIVIGLAVLRCLDAHRVDEFAVNLGSTHLTFLSAIDQLAFSIDCDPDPSATSANPPPLWTHDSRSDRDCPQRDDMSTYLIAIHYHPWFTPMTGWQRPRGWKRFDIIAPWGPQDRDVLLGRGVIFPTWWPIALLSPTILWLAVWWVNQFRRRFGRPRIERRFAIMPFAST